METDFFQVLIFKMCAISRTLSIAETLSSCGVDSELFWIGNNPVRDCIACFQCRKNGNSECVFQDDIYAEFIQKMRHSDALIVGSPVYFAGPTGNVCSLLDRACFSASRDFVRKPAACVVNCRRGGATAAFDRLNKFFTILQMPVVSSTYWNGTHGTKPEEVLQDKEGLQVMRFLGRNMANMLLHAESNLMSQPDEPKISTNFIR